MASSASVARATNRSQGLKNIPRARYGVASTATNTTSAKAYAPVRVGTTAQGQYPVEMDSDVRGMAEPYQLPGKCRFRWKAQLR
jgi:hypothetical protein